MSDIPINTASFNQAYRAYAIEQGNDPSLGQVKAKDVSNQTTSVAALSAEQAVDSAYVSPEAARLYAQQLKQKRRINESRETEAEDAEHSATAEDADPSSIPHPHNTTTLVNEGVRRPQSES